MRILNGLAICTLAAALLTSGCGNDGGLGENILDQRVPLPAAPEYGVQFVTPEIEFEPYSEKQVCWYTTMPYDTDQWMLMYQAFQGDFGHHIVGFTTLESSVPDGTIIDCTDPESMASWGPLLLPADGTGPSVFPEGLGLVIPGGTRIVFQIHYVNSSDKTLLVRDVVNIELAVDPTGLTPTAPFASTTLDFQIPTGGETTLSYDCDFTQDVSVYVFFGHMHDSGKSIKVMSGPPGQQELMYEIKEWNVEYRDRPVLMTRTLDDPYVFKAGDRMTLTCSWNNLGDHTMGFPEEMCATMSYHWPASNTKICVEPSY